MKAFRMNEADLLIPSGWKDNSVYAFVATDENGAGSASLVMVRDLEPQQHELISYADQQLVLAAQKLPGYQLIGRTPLTIGGQPAIQSDFSWHTPDQGSLRQRQACVKWHNMFLVFTLTAKEPAFAHYEGAWGQVLGSVTLRET